MSGTNLYAVGEFGTAGGVSANNIAKWDGSAWSTWSSRGIDFTVETLAVSGTVIYAGGLRGGGCVNNPIKWDGRAWSGLGSGIFDGVFALVVAGTDLYAGGQNQIAKWDSKAWSALGSGIGPRGDYRVNALVVSGTNLYAGGDFTTAGGVSATNIAKWDGSAWSALGSGMDGQVLALAVSGTNLYAGGYFTTAGGVPATNIAKWDGRTWSALGAGINNEVHALAVSGSNLYAGGWFTTAGGVLANGIAKWDGSAWSALGSGVGAGVNALAVSGADLFAGGAFDAEGEAPGNFIARWDGRAWSALESGLNGWVWALALDGSGHLFVGGSFSWAGTNASYCIAQANVASAPTMLVPPRTQTAEVGATVDLAVEAAGGVLTYQWFFNDTNALTGVTTDSHLVLSDLQFSQSGAYIVVVTNVVGAVTSAPVMVSVIPTVERRPAAGVRLMGEAGSLLNVDYADALNPMAAWNPVGSVSLTSPPQYYFDTSEPLPPQRFYRAWQTGAPSVMPSLDLHLVPAITLTGTIGHSVRLDYINRFGPTDAWFSLATVSLTNTSQLSFDVSAPGQPERLYRLVQVP